MLWMIYSILELSKINALLYQAEKDVTVVAMDDILYSRTVQDCERFCDDVSKHH